MIRQKDGVQYGVIKSKAQNYQMYTNIKYFFDWISDNTGLTLPDCWGANWIEWILIIKDFVYFGIRIKDFAEKSSPFCTFNLIFTSRKAKKIWQIPRE